MTKVFGTKLFGDDAALAEDWSFEAAGGSANPALGRMATIAGSLFKAPIAHLTLIEGGVLKTASHFGPPLPDLAGFSQLRDATLQRRQPLVSHAAGDDAGTGGSFFVGVPVVTRDGMTIGALCVVDTAPRPDPAAADLAGLQDLAVLVTELVAAPGSRGQVSQGQATVAPAATALAALPAAPHTGLSARGLRADIAQAAGVDAALESLMFTLGRSQNAHTGALWRRTAGQAHFDRLCGFGSRPTDGGTVSELGSGVVAGRARTRPAAGAHAGHGQ